MREPIAQALDDACRWAELVARRLAGGLPPEMADRGARVKLAAERAVRWVHLCTWAPDDPEPATPPESVYDVRGARWLWQPWDKTWRMFAEDKRRYTKSPEVPTSDQTWNELLNSSGPLTERQAPRTQRLP
jgi:hypothetical protein